MDFHYGQGLAIIVVEITVTITALALLVLSIRCSLLWLLENKIKLVACFYYRCSYFLVKQLHYSKNYVKSIMILSAVTVR